MAFTPPPYPGLPSPKSQTSNWIDTAREAAIRELASFLGCHPSFLFTPGKFWDTEEEKTYTTDQEAEYRPIRFTYQKDTTNSPTSITEANWLTKPTTANP